MRLVSRRTLLFICLFFSSSPLASLATNAELDEDPREDRKRSLGLGDDNNDNEEDGVVDIDASLSPLPPLATQVAPPKASRHASRQASRYAIAFDPRYSFVKNYVERREEIRRRDNPWNLPDRQSDRSDGIALPFGIELQKVAMDGVYSIRKKSGKFASESVTVTYDLSLQHLAEREIMCKMAGRRPREVDWPVLKTYQRRARVRGRVRPLLGTVRRGATILDDFLKAFSHWERQAKARRIMIRSHRFGCSVMTDCDSDRQAVFLCVFATPNRIPNRHFRVYKNILNFPNKDEGRIEEEEQEEEEERLSEETSKKNDPNDTDDEHDDVALPVPATHALEESDPAGEPSTADEGVEKTNAKEETKRKETKRRKKSKNEKEKSEENRRQKKRLKEEEESDFEKEKSKRKREKKQKQQQHQRPLRDEESKDELTETREKGERNATRNEEASLTIGDVADTPETTGEEHPSAEEKLEASVKEEKNEAGPDETGPDEAGSKTEESEPETVKSEIDPETQESETDESKTVQFETDKSNTSETKSVTDETDESKTNTLKINEFKTEDSNSAVENPRSEKDRETTQEASEDNSLAKVEKEQRLNNSFPTKNDSIVSSVDETELKSASKAKSDNATEYLSEAPTENVSQAATEVSSQVKSEAGAEAGAKTRAEAEEKARVEAEEEAKDEDEEEARAKASSEAASGVTTQGLLGTTLEISSSEIATLSTPTSSPTDVNQLKSQIPTETPAPESPKDAGKAPLNPASEFASKSTSNTKSEPAPLSAPAPSSKSAPKIASESAPSTSDMSRRRRPQSRRLRPSPQRRRRPEESLDPLQTRLIGQALYLGGHRGVNDWSLIPGFEHLRGRPLDESCVKCVDFLKEAQLDFEEAARFGGGGGYGGGGYGGAGGDGDGGVKLVARPCNYTVFQNRGIFPIPSFAYKWNLWKEGRSVAACRALCDAGEFGCQSFVFARRLGAGCWIMPGVAADYERHTLLRRNRNFDFYSRYCDDGSATF